MKIGKYKLIKNDMDGYFFSGSLYLSGTAITSLPENLTVGGSLDLSGTAITSLPENLTVGGYLYLKGTAITSLPENLTVGGYLYLKGTAITSLPDNLTVGGSLYLKGTAITSLPDNLTVGGYLDLSGTAITSLPDNLTVGGSLDLSGTAITSLPDNLTVGGSLYLKGTAITSLPENLTVGGYLYLKGTAITSLPENLTVGGYLYLKGTAITNNSKVDANVHQLLSWKNGRYIKVDGIFAEVINKKSSVFKLKKIGRKDVFYSITDGNGKWAHGESIKNAKLGLIYKISESANKEKYLKLKLDSILNFRDCIEFYRVMTGACAFGVKDFIESNNIESRDYSIAEIIKKTKGKYGSNALTVFVN